MRIWNDEAPTLKELYWGEVEAEQYEDFWRSHEGLRELSPRELRIQSCWLTVKQFIIFKVCGSIFLKHDWDCQDYGDTEYGPSPEFSCNRCYAER